MYMLLAHHTPEHTTELSALKLVVTVGVLIAVSLAGYAAARYMARK